MRTIFSTANVAPAEAFDYWNDAAQANIAKNRIETDDRRTFKAELRTGSLAGLSIANWQASPMTSYGIGSDDLNLPLITTPILVECGERRFELDQHSVCLFDHRQPYTARSFDPIDRTIVRVPRDELGRRIPFEAAANQPITVTGGIALLSAYVGALVRIGPSTLSAAEAALACEQTLDWIAAMVASVTGETPRLGAASRFEILKLRIAIDGQLTNPDANRQSIAAAAGVSERQANRLLAREGTSVQRLLTQRRLEKCREALVDPLQRHDSIRHIALSFGFRDMSHFTHGSGTNTATRRASIVVPPWLRRTFVSRPASPCFGGTSTSQIPKQPH
jgi:AraC-like DNA-binding protein